MGRQHNASCQHKDSGIATWEQDMRCMKKIMDWFQMHNPFDSGVSELLSLASSLTAGEGDGVNCDAIERVGLEIQCSMDNQPVSYETIKISQMVCTLNDLKQKQK